MKKIYTLGIASLLVIVLVPNLALAVWWNPFTWFVKKQVEKPVISQIDTSSTESNPIVIPQESKGVKNIEKDTPKIETKPVKKISPQNALISEFLANPTLENFKVFCEKAKALDGKKTKEVLSPDKQSLITQKESMFSDFKECNFGNKSIDDSSKEGLYSGRYFLLPLNEDLLIDFEDSDLDWFRESKIIYNNKVNNLLKNSKTKVVIFYNSSGKKEVKNPKDLFNYYFSQWEKTENKDTSNTINLKSYKTKIRDVQNDINELKISNSLYKY